MPTRRFPVEYAVLGLLNEGPMHGYALRERLDSTLGPFWRIATSQIYSALHLLQQKGMTMMEVQAQPDRPPRNVYLITPQGREAYRAWCLSPVRHLRDMRVEFLAKLYFLHHSGSADVLSLIDKQTVFLKRLHARVSQRNNLPTDDQVLARLALRFRARQISATLKWLEECKQEFVQKGGNCENRVV